jgi:uncharacterized protein YdaU (DUF1376 family)
MGVVNPEPGPAFQFYARDWLTGQGTTRMTPEQKGAFIDLLAHAWVAKPPCTLPDDDAVLAKLSSLGARWKKVGPLVKAQFTHDGDGLLVNPKQAGVYRQLLQYRSQKSHAGRCSADARRDKFGTAQPRTQESAEQAPNTHRTETRTQDRTVPEPSSSSSSSSASSRERDRAREGGSNQVITSSALSKRARAFIERYPRIYARCRAGAEFRVREARDFEAFVELVDRERSDDRLDALLELFLRTKSKDFLNSPGTPRQLLHMLPECDRLLREHGR